MLIMTRRVNERIIIGDGIIVAIIGISRDLVRLGIEAPKEVPVNREEVLLRKQPGTPRGPQSR